MRGAWAAIAAVSLAACGGGDPAIIALTVSPTTASPGDDVILTVTVENFELVDPELAAKLTPKHTGNEEAAEGEYPDEGHFHVYVDSVEENPVLLNCPEYCKHPGFQEQVRLTVSASATPAVHEIIVRLNDNLHRILQPEIRRSVQLTIQ